jgi:hypothetical protein
MANKNYTAIISVNATPKVAFEKIAKVDGWWAKKFSGKALNENDTFKVRFGETFVDFKITEAIPGKKIVWHVTDCNLHWINNKKEWRDTQVVWKLTPENGRTQIKMTHEGLVPGVECYNDCETGWNGHVKGSLVAFINENKGRPE